MISEINATCLLQTSLVTFVATKEPQKLHIQHSVCVLYEKGKFKQKTKKGEVFCH